MRDTGNTCRCEHHRVAVDAEKILDHGDGIRSFPGHFLVLNALLLPPTKKSH